MKKLNYILSIISIVFFLILTNNVNALNGKPTKVPDKDFKISSKSKTIKMAKGDTYSIKAKLRENRYYFFSADFKRKAGCLQFRIIDPVNDEILFDNSLYEFEDNVTFFNDYERNVIIEIKTLQCYKNRHKERKVEFVYANKKVKRNQDFDYGNYDHLYAVL